MSKFSPVSLRLLLSLLASALLAAPSSVSANVCGYPTGDFSCDIAITWNGPKPPEGTLPQGHEALQSVNVTRIGKTIRYQFRWAGDRITEIWKDAPTGLWVQQSDDPGNKSIYIDPQLMVWAPPLAQMDEGTINWIDASCFKEEVTFQGRKALRYERQMTFPYGATPIYQAWIDAETKRPIGFHDGESQYVLSYSKQPPTGPLEMPPVLRQELDRQLKASKGPSYL